MKKIILLFLGIAALSTSCSKYYTCTCNVTTGTVNGSQITNNTVVEVIDSSYPKIDVQNECNSYGEVYVGSNGTYTCSIK